MELTQTTLTAELNWKNQSEVSKSMQRLLDMQLIEKHGHKTRVLTERGYMLMDLLNHIDSNSRVK